MQQVAKHVCPDELNSVLVTMSRGARELAFCDCISKVTITEQFTPEYMDIFRSYPVHAKLIDRLNK